MAGLEAQLAGIDKSIFLLELDVADNPLREKLVPNPLWPIAGGMPVPDSPGLGLGPAAEPRQVGCWRGLMV
jgi:hypothetical protein